MAQDPEESPFAALSRLRDALPPGPTAAPATPVQPEGKARPIPRAVVRVQRKGYGGKTVTLVEKLELPAPELEALVKKLKTQLGVGGRVDGDLLVVQGDCRDRVVEFLTKLGVKKVTAG